MNEDFEWPCDKHYAHGPHWAPKYDEEGIPCRGICLGVKAHPNTMIGRQQR